MSSPYTDAFRTGTRDMPSYDPATVEPKWQRFWDENKTFRTPDPGDPSVAGKKTAYLLDMFPYPSGAGLHVGHPEGYTATDILARFKRMRGEHVLHPMGWDAFGLPAEQYAIQTGTHPRETTATNIATFRRQIKALGFSYDWDREVDTTDPAYVKWTQWIFLLIHDTWYDTEAKRGRPISELPIPAAVVGEDAIRKYRDSHRLAFQSEQPVNWCPELGTVLANEEVQDGKSERGGHPVERRPLRQWLLRITAYAERLIDDLGPLDWSESIKQMQRNWIGRSEGATVRFPAGYDVIEVFTTRPDTLFGATYMVLAPEHPLVTRLTTPDKRAAVEAYQQATARKSDFDRMNDKTKTGVFTGGYATNPANSQQIPVWIADYVLAAYGSGAIMAVPAHDVRDYQFARKYALPIVTVVDRPADEQASFGPKLIEYHRQHFGTGHFYSAIRLTLESPDATLKAAAAVLKQLGIHESGVIVTDEGCEGVVLLVPLKVGEFSSRFRGPLAQMGMDEAYEWEGTAINSGLLDGLPTSEAKVRIIAWLEQQGHGHRQVNYKLRDWLFSRQRYWGEPFPILHGPAGEVIPVPVEQLPVRLPELADFKPTGTPDGPLAKSGDWLTVTLDGVSYRRETNTMPQWAGSCWYYLRYIDPHNQVAFADKRKLDHWLPVDLYVGGAEHAVLHLMYSRFWHKVLFDRGYVSCPEPFQRLVNQGMILAEDNQKMSKARGNVVNPDDIIREYGADSLRLYEMFMGPLEAVKPWSTKSIEGVTRFLGRVWRLVVDDSAVSLALGPLVTGAAPDADTLRLTHRTIQKVTDDTAALKFNTAIAALMEFTNHLTALKARPRQAVEALVLLLAPYAPHAAEELWQALGRGPTLAYAPWPAFDPALVVADTIEVPVQVNGKIKTRLRVPAGTDAAGLEAAARSDAAVVAALVGKTVKKTVVVPGKLVNLVAG